MYEVIVYGKRNTVEKGKGAKYSRKDTVDKL